MNELNPGQIFQLSKNAYTTKKGDSVLLRRELDIELPFVNIDSLRIITATSGLITPVSSGFGFMAQLNGGRSREIVIATRGTTHCREDYGTDINAIPTLGPTGHAIHKGFGTTFKSYVQQLNEFIRQQNLGFKPTAVHCMGHSLGGALANLNAAACAELGLNSYLYTVAAPRVGMVPYAEHLSKKMKAAHVYRVANEADVVTMLPTYPFVHSPYVHGTYLFEGGMLKINPMQHKLAIGYSSMVNGSWKQMQSLTQGKQQQLENSLYPANNKEAGQFEQLAKMPGAMFSGRLLKLINKAIHDMLSRLGAQSLLSVGHYGTGAFTVLDQMAEILARYAQASHKQAKEVAGMLNAVMAYLGRATHTVADASVVTIRWVFNLLHLSVNTMAKQAIQLVGR
ncbi:lipase family protein [Limnobacter profundi]|uniref:lipase family protein n=1 Tax=Limnobacter profundi TaxID=2732163 RepID=UPI00197DC6DD|nr:lipase [Limnobacter sp. SAORIC-580]